jgi:HK97 family phage major capsid protein
MKIQEHIRALEATRSAKAARLHTLIEKSETTGISLDDAEGQEFDTIREEIKQVEKDLDRARYTESLAVSQARTVETQVERSATSQDRKESERRGNGSPTIIIRNAQKDDAFKGQSFVRMVIAKAMARLDGETPAWVIAQKRWGDSARTVVDILRAAVAGGGTGSGEWGAELVAADAQYRGDFIDYLYNKTVYDRLPLRQVPAHVTIKGQDGQGTGYWVGESKGIPATTLDFNSVTLTPLKVAALAVISNDLIRYSDPAAEGLVRDGLVNASSQRVDSTFFSTAAAVSGVSPAGILNGATLVPSDGTDAESLRNDIRSLYAGFLTAKNATDLALIMTPGLAKAISLMTNAFSQQEFPGLNANGGSLLGDTVYTGDNVGAAQMILLKPSDIYRIGDTGFEVSISREATIEQATDPTGATDTPVAMANFPTNMFQEDSSAIRVIRHINFAKRRSSAVAYIADAGYSQSAT